jgi:hypothetical protein
MQQGKNNDNLDIWRKKTNNSRSEKHPYGQQIPLVDAMKRNEKKWFFETIERQHSDYFPFGKGGFYLFV